MSLLENSGMSDGKFGDHIPNHKNRSIKNLFDSNGFIVKFHWCKALVFLTIIWNKILIQFI
jgi:hypothetical protein